MSIDVVSNSNVAAIGEPERGKRSWTAFFRTLPGGMLVLLAMCGLAAGNLSSFNMFIFNSALLAIIGAASLNLLMGTAGQVSIGNAAFLAAGAFSTVFFTRAGIPMPFDVLAAGLVCAALGFLVGLPALRLRGHYLALSTLAAHFIVLYLALRYQSAEAGSGGFFLEPLFPGASQLESQWYWMIVIAAAVLPTIWIVGRLMRGQSGRAMRIIRDQESIAGPLGIPAVRYKLGIFTATSALIGVQGGLTAHFTSSVSTDPFTFLLAVQYIAMTLIGGRDSILGSVIGAGIVVTLPYLTPELLAPFLSDATATSIAAPVSSIVYGSFIIYFVTRSPDGVVGWLRKARLRVGRLSRSNRVKSGGGSKVTGSEQR